MRVLAGCFTIAVFVLVTHFAARTAEAQQDPLLGLHNCEAYYPKAQWFKKCAPFCYGILNNAGYLPPECNEWINGPARPTSPRHCTARIVHQYENQITYTRRKSKTYGRRLRAKPLFSGFRSSHLRSKFPSGSAAWLRQVISTKPTNLTNCGNDIKMTGTRTCRNCGRNSKTNVHLIIVVGKTA
jgi:hypothetical protein